MAASLDKPTSTPDTKSTKDKPASSPKMSLFSKDSKSKSPKKGKDAQGNGVEQTPNSGSANAAGGSVSATGAGDASEHHFHRCIGILDTKRHV